MRISRPRAQFMDFDLGQANGQEREPVKILVEELQRVHHFKYLGSSVEETGGMATESAQRVSAAWRNWKRCSGIFLFFSLNQVLLTALDTFFFGDLLLTYCL